MIKEVYFTEAKWKPTHDDLGGVSGKIVFKKPVSYQDYLSISRKEYLLLDENKDKEIERLNNIINTILDFNFFKEECPLNLGYTEKCDEEKAQDVFYEDDYCEENCNDIYKKCWLKYFEKLQELKENK